VNNFKKGLYTIILLFTCVVASPIMFRKIWENSDIKQQKAAAKAPVISTQPAAEDSEGTTEAPKETQPTSEGETAAATEAATAAPEPAKGTFVQSGPEYFDDALFIGDSRTVGIRDYGTLKNADYFCDIGLSAYKINETTIGGSTVWGALNAKPYGKIYVMLGINEVGNDIERTVSAYRQLIDGIREVQPDAIIYIEGNLHVTPAAETTLISNERLNMLNSRMSEMADGVHTYYIDINSVFDDETGALTADYTSDGIHVLGKYYATWCEWLCANTVSQGQPAAAAPAENAQAEEAATYVSEPAETEAATQGLPQNEEFSNQ